MQISAYLDVNMKLYTNEIHYLGLIRCRISELEEEHNVEKMKQFMATSNNPLTYAAQIHKEKNTALTIRSYHGAEIQEMAP
jgi:hypothetical protein